MDDVKIAGELIKIARSLVAADPKVSVTKTVKFHVVSKNEAAAGSETKQRVERELRSGLNQYLKTSKLGGWIADVEVDEPTVKPASGDNRFDVSTKVRATVQFSHSSRVSDAVNSVISKLSSKINV